MPKIGVTTLRKGPVKIGILQDKQKAFGNSLNCCKIVTHFLNWKRNTFSLLSWDIQWDRLLWPLKIKSIFQQSQFQCQMVIQKEGIKVKNKYTLKACRNEAVNDQAMKQNLTCLKVSIRLGTKIYHFKWKSFKGT